MNEDARVTDVSVVVPVFNEAESLPRAIREITATLDGCAVRFELVFVDDGSRDASRSIITAAAQQDSRIVLLSFSRNFGKEAALAAGLHHACGRCVIFMDADLQHPAGVIPEMLSRWSEGYDVVNARKRTRGRESVLSRLFAAGFNRLMSEATKSDFQGASDFKLIDRRVLEILQRLPERNRFFRGLVSWVGFRTIDVEFDVADRLEGGTKWSFSSLLSYSLRSLVAFSNLPLRIVAYSGFLISAAGAAILLKALVDYFSGQALTGFTTMIGIQVLVGGMLLIAQGTISLYIAKMYEEQKARPIYIIDERVSIVGAARPTIRRLPDQGAVLVADPSEKLIATPAGEAGTDRL
jgi:dolichol-phosphate mannosyltransferase